MKKKQIISLLLSVTMLLCMATGLTIVSFAEESTFDHYIDPYQISISSTYYANIKQYTAGDEEIESSFSMMGNKFIQGVTFYHDVLADGSYDVYYNLSEQYRIFTFNVGHVDNEGRGELTLSILADGEIIDTITLTHGMETLKYSLNVSGINNLRIKCNGGGSFRYAIADTCAYTEDEVTTMNMTVPAGYTIEKVFKTSDDVDAEYTNPYQISISSTYYANIKQYTAGDEEIESSFSMMGNKFIQGVTFYHDVWASDSFDVYYNLAGMYQSFAFDVGHIDNGGNGSLTLYIFKDGEQIEQLDLTADMVNKHFNINVEGVNQFHIHCVGGGSKFTYGIANSKAAHTHEWASEATIDVFPTCLKDGTQSIHCLTCGKSDKSSAVVIDALGHDYVNEVCTRCGNRAVHKHKWAAEKTVSVEPTCELAGEKAVYCLTCGEADPATIEVIPALGHNYVDNVCTRCGKPEKVIPSGDVNNDGVTNSKDLTRLMKVVAGEMIDAVGGDINGDGVVNSKDLTRLMKFIAGAISELA